MQQSPPILLPHSDPDGLPSGDHCARRCPYLAPAGASSNAASTASVTSSSLGNSQPHIPGLTRQCTTPGRQGDGGSGTQPPRACSTTSGWCASWWCSVPPPSIGNS